MRASIVRQRIELLFFCTNRGGVRVLSGYYRLGWYYKVPHSQSDDYMLAAKEARFVAPGFPLRDLKEYLHEVQLDTQFRTFRYVDGATAERLLLLLNDTPDATSQYVAEIRRLEQWSLDKYGHVYISRSRGFSWEDAAKPMKLGPYLRTGSNCQI
jgi:hypothetical protein